MGPTPCSFLVASKAETIREEITKLLGRAAVRSEEYWMPIWRQALDVNQRTEARQLIIETVMLVGAGWHLRVMEGITSFH